MGKGESVKYLAKALATIGMFYFIPAIIETSSHDFLVLVLAGVGLIVIWGT